MRSPFLKKCHKVRLLLAALCGLAFTSHLDAVTTLSNLKRLEADLTSQLAKPTKKVKSVLKRYNALRNAELQAKSQTEAQQMESLMNRLAEEIKQGKARKQHTAKNKHEEMMFVILGGMRPVKRSVSSIDIVSGPPTPMAAAAKPKSPNLLGGGGHGLLKQPKKRPKPAISPKPSPEKIAANKLKKSHQNLVHTLKKHHAHTEVAAAKANLAKVNAENAREEAMDRLSEHSSTSPTHTSPTHSPTSEPVAPDPDNMVPPPPPMPPTSLTPPGHRTSPTTPKRPSADMLKEGRLKLSTPIKEASSPTDSSDSSDLVTALHQQVINKFKNTGSYEDDDDSDEDDDGGWGDED